MTPLLNRKIGLKKATKQAAEFGCAFVMLGHGRFALIDKEDVARVARFSWSFHRIGKSDRGYARTRTHNKSEFGGAYLYLHRYLVEPKYGMLVDHKNSNGLDCRRSNMRECTHAQNTANSTKGKAEKLTKFKGVEPCGNGFQVRGKCNGVRVRMGGFKTQIEAAIAYNAWAKSAFGEFAFLNPV